MDAREHLILLAAEQDRPGLVAELTGFTAAQGCNVEDSRVAVIGGYAGLIFLISGTSAQITAVEEGLDQLERTTGIKAMVRRLAKHSAPNQTERTHTYVVTAHAIDHEGLIHAITDTVRAHGGNILELETSTESAPMSGSPLFSLRMVTTLAERYGSPDRLQTALDLLSRTEAIDLEMHPAEEHSGTELRSLRLI